MEWGFRENCVVVIALHKCRKSDSQIFELLKPLKISSIRQLNIIRNSGVLKTGLSQDAWKMWGLKLLSKLYGRVFAEIRSG